MLSLMNLKIISHDDFDSQITGAVLLNSEGKKKLIKKWQEKKRSEVYHPVLKENVPYGLLPYIQSNLLAKYIRGETAEYIPLLLKKTIK